MLTPSMTAGQMCRAPNPNPSPSPNPSPNPNPNPSPNPNPNPDDPDPDPNPNPSSSPSPSPSPSPYPNQAPLTARSTPQFDMAGNVTNVPGGVSVDSYCNCAEGDVAPLFDFTGALGANYSGNLSLNLYPSSNPNPNF